MAIIKCPNCNEDISDKSIKCVHCGEIINKETKIVCPECGNEVKKNHKTCSNCGCPIEKNITPQQVEVTKVKIMNNLSKRKIIIGVIVILVIISIIFGISSLSKKNSIEKYQDNLNNITLEMLNGAAEAENCGNLIKKVWYNTIYEESDWETNKYTQNSYGYFNDDFNDSLKALFSDPSFIEKLDSIEENQENVKDLMKDMKNPPEEFEEAYDDLKEYYDNYLTLTNLVINPSGSLTTFSNNFNDADSNTVNSYEKMKTYIEQ